MRLTPTIHPDYHVGLRVEAELEPGRKVLGRIVGVSWQHIFSVYIVLLDEPLKVPGWAVPWEAVTLPGGQLRPLGGESVAA